MTIPIDEAVLDDAQAMEQADPGQMLRAVASAGAQVRQAATAAAEADLGRLVADGRPRAVVVTGMGGSGISADVLAAVAGSGCPVPIVPVRGYTLPGWVSAVDLVAAVSCSGSTEETLTVAAEAARRGCRMLTVGAVGSPLHALGEAARGVHIPVDAGGRLPRANMWALSVPLLAAAHALELADVDEKVLAKVADQLDQLAETYRPSNETFLNPAKALAVEIAGSLPMLWGSSELASVAAYRFACQLNENTKYPAVFGALPEANHNQVVAFDGALAGSGDDIFADDGAGGSARLRLVVLRDTVEHPQVRRRREVSVEIAESRSIPVSEVAADGEHALERLAALVGLTDYASVYAAFALGADPTPITSISELKERIAG